MSADLIKRKVEEAVSLYNRYRKPEAEAVVEDLSGDTVRVVFRGSFCRTCGIRDWVEDFKYILESLGVENDLVEYIEPEDDEYTRIGVFRIKAIREDSGA